MWNFAHARHSAACILFGLVCKLVLMIEDIEDIETVKPTTLPRNLWIQLVTLVELHLFSMPRVLVDLRYLTPAS